MPHLPCTQTHPPPLFLVCKCGILPFLPYIYSSVFTLNLRRFCREQICANPFFRPVLYTGPRLVSVVCRLQSTLALRIAIMTKTMRNPWQKV